MPGPLRVAIVGAGTAGPAAALLLARDGHAVELFEAFAEPLPLGAGILLQPTGLAVLGELGLRDAIEAAGAPVTRVFGRAAGGRVVLDVHYRDMAPDAAGLGIHRGALFGSLYAALAPAGVTLRLGAPVERLAADALVAGGSRHGPYDLIVIADGSRSALRRQTGIPVRTRTSPYGAVWGIAPDEDGAFADTLWQAYDGTRTMVGTLPTGRSAGGLAARTDAAFGTDGHPMTSIFWSVRNTDADAFLARPRAELRAAAAATSPHLGALVDRLDGALTHAVYRDVRMPEYHRGRTVILGDAAHAMSPQLGQGANLALMDASALAACLREAPVAEALARYSARRRAHNRFYQRASRWLTPFFQSDLELLAPLRDGLTHPLTRPRWVRRQMALTLAGCKTAPFSELPPG